jgi:uroporphyrinogen-III decarboxylase
MTKVRVPGVDLPPDALWQVEEKELMTREDYGRILEQGWPEFFDNFMRNRIFDDVPEESLPPKWKSLDVRGAWAAHGVPVLSSGDVTTPIELLCGARSLEPFCFDLVEIPDQVESVMDAMVSHLATTTIRQAKERGYPMVWVGGWRGAPCLFSPELWQRFVWPYYYRLAQEVVDSGLIALLHLDSDWTRELKRFREFPKGKCVMALDGETDIFKAKEVLGDHMCLMGDVPATMLFMDTQEEVHEYCTRLIRELGPEGFILQSGCDIPVNAKLENVQAMVAAVGG